MPTSNLHKFVSRCYHKSKNCETLKVKSLTFYFFCNFFLVFTLTFSSFFHLFFLQNRSFFGQCKIFFFLLLTHLVNHQNDVTLNLLIIVLCIIKLLSSLSHKSSLHFYQELFFFTEEKTKKLIKIPKVLQLGIAYNLF